MRILSMLAVLAIVGVLSAKPDRPAPKQPPKEIPVPNLAGLCNWGVISQNARRLSIKGSSSWECEGEIRQDGKVQLLWTCLSDNRRAIGVYAAEMGSLQGHWGWEDEAKVDEGGDLIGILRTERVVKIEPDF